MPNRNAPLARAARCERPLRFSRNVGRELEAPRIEQLPAQRRAQAQCGTGREGRDARR